MTIKVKSNYHPREVLYWYDLTENEREYVKSDLDYLELPEDHEYFRYANELYCISDFILPVSMWSDMPFEMFSHGRKWNGYTSFGFVGGLTIHYPYMEDGYIEDYDHLIVGWY